ncbi:PREDICTED: protein angel [Nicrophorus vespilloides]|uniref:Protein angel n=1 Tax=Nicrophorus vespilloides TaxID=110193 RepID=A0ABM1LZW5_NICVS|nr:PREDICTED: protein angel [Nicrophorus vespilloides]
MDFPQTTQSKFQNASTLTRQDLSVKEKLGSDFRQWQQVNRSRGQPSENSVTFKIMSYNVLAQDLLERHRNLYKDNAQSCLKWNFRFEKIYNEIKRHNCDILCLQEVQQNHLDSYYRKYLSELGYNTILYKKRTGDCPDGCAIFYNSNLFTLIESQTVEYFQPNVSVLNKDNIGLIAKFAPIGYEYCSFIVATTHLLYNPNRHDIRLAQIQLFLAEIDRVSFNVSHHVPVIITGDFNSMYNYAPVRLLLTAKCPFDNVQKNGLLPYQLGVSDNCQHVRLVAARRKKPYMSQEMQRKYVHLHHGDYPQATDNLKENNSLFNTGYLTHNFAFKSIYDNPSAEATTYQNRWLTVDYIFYSGRNASKSPNKNHFKEDKLVLLSRYSLPVGSKLPSVTIPNENLGSDHLSLMAEFKLIL